MAFSRKTTPRVPFPQWHRGCDAVFLMIVTFFGTKGGTGTTTLAVNCAADIQRVSNRPTLIVDAKQGPGDVSVFLGLRPRYTLVELIDSVGWSDRNLMGRFVAEHDCGLHLVAASEGFGRPNSRDAEAVDQMLRAVSQMYEFVVVDAGCTLNSAAVSAMVLADVVMLVANPDVPCLRNFQRLTDAIRLVGVPPERVRMALNRTSENGVLPIAQIEKVLGRTVDFRVLSDYRTVAAAINTGVPVYCLRSTELHLQMDAMARALVGRRFAAAS